MLTPGEEDVQLELVLVDKLGQNCSRYVTFHDMHYDSDGAAGKRWKAARCSNPRVYASDACKTHDTKELQHKIDQLKAEIGRLGGSRILLQE